MKEFLAHIRQNLDISRFPPRVTTLNGFPELSSRNEYFQDLDIPHLQTFRFPDRKGKW
jgi:hypothetical protein